RNTSGSPLRSNMPWASSGVMGRRSCRAVRSTKLRSTKLAVRWSLPSRNVDVEDVVELPIGLLRPELDFVKERAVAQDVEADRLPGCVVPEGLSRRHRARLLHRPAHLRAPAAASRAAASRVGGGRERLHRLVVLRLAVSKKDRITQDRIDRLRGGVC